MSLLVHRFGRVEFQMFVSLFFRQAHLKKSKEMFKTRIRHVLIDEIPRTTLKIRINMCLVWVEILPLAPLSFRRSFNLQGEKSSTTLCDKAVRRSKALPRPSVSIQISEASCHRCTTEVLRWTRLVMLRNLFWSIVKSVSLILLKFSYQQKPESKATNDF